MKRKGGDVEMEKIRAIVDRQESRKETGMFLLFLGESLFVFSYFMKMSDFLFGMGLGSWNRKKSFEEYRRYLLRLSYFILALSSLSLVLASLIRDNDFASGLMLGGSSAGLVFAIYYWLLSRQPKRLKAAYIALYDERNQYILRVTAVSTLIFMFLVNVIMIALYAFLGIAFSYVILLMIWLYCLLLGFLGLRIIFSKIL